MMCIPRISAYMYHAVKLYLLYAKNNDADQPAGQGLLL